MARIATAIGAVAVDAFAIGAMAIGRLVIRRLSVENAALKSLAIEDLSVTPLRAAEVTVSQSLTLPGPTPIAGRRHSRYGSIRSQIGRRRTI